MLIKFFCSFFPTQCCKIADVINECFQTSFSNFFWIFYPQCSRRCISWICQWWQPLLYQLLVVLFKIIFIDKNLSSYFHLLQSIRRKFSRKGDAFYLFDVSCY